MLAMCIEFCSCLCKVRSRVSDAFSQALCNTSLAFLADFTLSDSTALIHFYLPRTKWPLPTWSRFIGMRVFRGVKNGLSWLDGKECMGVRSCLWSNRLGLSVQVRVRVKARDGEWVYSFFFFFCFKKWRTPLRRCHLWKCGVWHTAAFTCPEQPHPLGGSCDRGHETTWK